MSGRHLSQDEYEKIPEELKYRIVAWFERHAHTKTTSAYYAITHPKVADMYHDLMESVDPSAGDSHD